VDGYPGEPWIRLEYDGLTGAPFRELYVDGATLRERAVGNGWRCSVAFGGEGGYLAMLTR
jgi:hypothetical protein